MKKLIKNRSVVSASAASAVLAAAMFTSPAMAVENDTYKTIHNGWLSEYQIQPGEQMADTNRVYRAVSADNDTFATIHNGYLSEYESIDTSGVVAMFDMSESAAYEGATRKEWLDMDGYRK